MVLFIMLYKVVLTFKSVDETLVCSRPFKMKAIEQYFHVVMFIMLQKVILSLKAVLLQVVSREIERTEQN